MTTTNPGVRNTDYALLNQQMQALLRDEPDRLANTCNFVALLFNALDAVNWLGVYILRDDELVLGPFQGQTACVRIPMGRGVCGTAAASREAINVADVLSFPGHIACDAASRSEVVVPLEYHGTLWGVLDVDSPEKARFSDADFDGLRELGANFMQLIGDHQTAKNSPFL